MLRVPAITGVIDRRILVNYHIDPDVLARALPAPFRPKVVNDHGIGGICLIRLKEIRPKFIPVRMGISSENAAHRIAVEWDGPDGPKSGVYIPRRDTNSRFNALMGGRLFPGEHHHARFDVQESDERFHVAVSSDDRAMRLAVDARAANSLPATSVFASLGDASAFFETGAVGYSATSQPDRFDGLELRCRTWKIDPLQVEQVESSYFEDPNRFPFGSVAFDCALLMRNIAHECTAGRTCALRRSTHGARPKTPCETSDRPSPNFLECPPRNPRRGLQGAASPMRCIHLAFTFLVYSTRTLIRQVIQTHPQLTGPA